MEYQRRTLVPVRKIIKSRDISNRLEKMADPEEEVMIDVKFAFYEFGGKEPNFEKYDVYAVKKVRELETPPRFLISVDRLIKSGKKTLRYRIN